jgi:putative SOS response-associated peptidase YedK
MEDRGRPQTAVLSGGEERGLAFQASGTRARPRSLLSCTIVVGRPNGLVAEIHVRMVVILPEAAYANWLDPRTSLDTVRSHMEPYPAACMRAWRVSPAVDNARKEGADLLRPP